MAESLQIRRVWNSVVVTHAMISAGPAAAYLLQAYSKISVITTDARMDPVRPTRFEKRKNMLPNVPRLQQFHAIDVRGRTALPCSERWRTYHPDQSWRSVTECLTSARRPPSWRVSSLQVCPDLEIASRLTGICPIANGQYTV